VERLARGLERGAAVGDVLGQRRARVVARARAVRGADRAGISNFRRAPEMETSGKERRKEPSRNK